MYKVRPIKLLSTDVILETTHIGFLRVSASVHYKDFTHRIDRFLSDVDHVSIMAKDDGEGGFMVGLKGGVKESAYEKLMNHKD